MPIILKQEIKIGDKVITNDQTDEPKNSGVIGIVESIQKDIISFRTLDGIVWAFQKYKIDLFYDDDVVEKEYIDVPNSILISDQDWLLLTNLLSPTSLKISQT